MMSARLLIIALIPFAFVSAHAQENVIVQKQPTVLSENSSEANRLGKKVVIGAQVLGMGLLGASGQGLALGYHFDRNTVAQLEFFSGVRKNNLDSIFDNYEAKVNSLSLHVKKFLANSFYVKGGIDYSTVKYNNKYIFTSSANKDAYGFEGNMVSASILIGNQWQWENFTLGCDWVGITLPISNQVTSEFSDTTVASNARYNKEDQEALLKNGTGQALRFYIGATF